MRHDENGREVFPLVSDSKTFATELKQHFNWFSGVPDSVLKNTQAEIEDFHFSSRENHAVGMAFGAHMGGLNPCILIQNSGLGLAIDALLGLFRLYDQGFVMIVSNRGELDWEEIQHLDWGSVTLPMLNSLEIPVIDFGEKGLGAIEEASRRAEENGEILIVLVHRGNLDE